MKAELHSHTVYSRKCGNIKPRDLIKYAKLKGLDEVVITDHDTIKGYLAVRKLRPDVKVVCGEEITTKDGELLGLFLTEEVKSGMSAEETIDEIHKQGGLAIAPHPFDIRNGLRSKITRLKLDGIEVFNSRTLWRKADTVARIHALQLGLTGTAGSDAHFPSELGTSYVEYEDDLYKAIKRNKLILHARYTPIPVHLSYALLNKFRKALQLRRQED